MNNSKFSFNHSGSTSPRDASLISNSAISCLTPVNIVFAPKINLNYLVKNSDIKPNTWFKFYPNKVPTFKILTITNLNSNLILQKSITYTLEKMNPEYKLSILELNIFCFATSRKSILDEAIEEIIDLANELRLINNDNLGKKPLLWKSFFTKHIKNYEKLN